MTPRPFVIDGVTVELDRGEVAARLRGVPADPIRTHWVEVDGRRWPVMQAFRVALGRNDLYFISHRAMQVFRALGFETSPFPHER